MKQIRIGLGLLGIILLCGPALAQLPPDQNGGGQDGPPRGRGPGAAQMVNRLHDEMQVNEEQWPTMSAKLTTILQLQRELYAGPPRGPGGRPPGGPDGGGPSGGGPNGDLHGGPPPGGPDAQAGDGPPPRPEGADGATSRPADETNASAEVIRDAKRSLGQLLREPDATPEEIRDAVKSLRDARTTAKSALTAAQSELKPMLNERQQAILLGFGIID